MDISNNNEIILINLENNDIMSYNESINNISWLLGDQFRSQTYTQMDDILYAVVNDTLLEVNIQLNMWNIIGNFSALTNNNYYGCLTHNNTHLFYVNYNKVYVYDINNHDNQMYSIEVLNYTIYDLVTPACVVQDNILYVIGNNMVSIDLLSLNDVWNTVIRKDFGEFIRAALYENFLFVISMFYIDTSTCLYICKRFYIILRRRIISEHH